MFLGAFLAPVVERHSARSPFRLLNCITSVLCSVRLLKEQATSAEAVEDDADSFPSRRLTRKNLFALAISNRLARNLISQMAPMKAGTHQTHSPLRIVIAAEAGVSAMRRNRVRNMVSSIFIDRTLSIPISTAALSGGDRQPGLILPNDAANTKPSR